MTKNENNKAVLIQYLDKWSRKTSIESRHMFEMYRERIVKNKYLTDGMLNHIVVFLEQEVEYDRKQLLKMLAIFKQPPATTTPSLEDFF